VRVVLVHGPEDLADLLRDDRRPAPDASDRVAVDVLAGEEELPGRAELLPVVGDDPALGDLARDPVLDPVDRKILQRPMMPSQSTFSKTRLEILVAGLLYH
jgi:hypothetical protein